MKRRYQIAVMMGCCREKTTTIEAENANDAVITGLSLMGLVTLELITGITIREVYL
jgi:hypothetical protein